MNVAETQYQLAAQPAPMPVIDSQTIVTLKPSLKNHIKQADIIHSLTRLRQLLSILKDTI
jgi:hypothetical protein